MTETTVNSPDAAVETPLSLTRAELSAMLKEATAAGVASAEANAVAAVTAPDVRRSEPVTFYDVIRMLVNTARLRDEETVLRCHDAIAAHEDASRPVQNAT